MSGNVWNRGKVGHFVRVIYGRRPEASSSSTTSYHETRRYFLNRFSKAARAARGREDDVSRSTVTRGE